MKRALVVTLLLVGLFGCQATPPDVGASAVAAPQVSASGIPLFDVRTSIIEADAHPEWNLAGLIDTPVLQADRFDDAETQPGELTAQVSGDVYNHHFRGYNIIYRNLYRAVQQTGDIQTDLNLPAPLPGEYDVILYAPTVFAPGGSCLEATFVHRKIGTAATKDYLGFWDWCRQFPGWDSYVEMTSAWQDVYAYPVGSEKEATVSIDKSGANCWTGSLLKKNGAWVTISESCGATKADGGTTKGWTIHEGYDVATVDRCPYLPYIKAHDIYLGPGGGTINTSLKSSPQNYSTSDFGYCWGEDWFFNSPASPYGSNSWSANTN